EHKDMQPLRYVAIRIRPRQGGLLNDGTQVKHFAVVSNIRQWNPARLLQWHREKAGTIEAVHDVLKNELSAGVLPCGRFGANTARTQAYTGRSFPETIWRIAIPRVWSSAPESSSSESKSDVRYR